MCVCAHAHVPVYGTALNENRQLEVFKEQSLDVKRTPLLLYWYFIDIFIYGFVQGDTEMIDIPLSA